MMRFGPARRRVISAMVIVMTMAEPAHAGRPYAVDDMLRLETIGKVGFDGTGGQLIFERYTRFDQQSDFARDFVPGELRSRLYRMDLKQGSRPELLIAQSTSDGYSLLGVAPEGRFVAYAHSFAGGQRAGIFPLTGGATREFEFFPEVNSMHDLPWVGDALALSRLPSGMVSMGFGARAERIEQLEDRWRHARRGDISTAGSVGSGTYASASESRERLVVADASSGIVHDLGPGRYLTLFASPDRLALAALRWDEWMPERNQLIEFGTNSAGVQNRLLVFDLEQHGAPIEACKGCDVMDSSLNWSPSGRYLAFAARGAGEGSGDVRVYVFDRRTGATKAAPFGNLTPHRGRVGASIREVQMAWIGDRLAAVLDTPTPGHPDIPTATSSAVRANWILLGARRPVNLTSAFEGEVPRLVAVSKHGLVMIHGAKAWLVGSDGSRHELTPGIADPVSAWREPSVFGQLPLYNPQPVGIITLETRPSSDDRPRQLLFVSIATGHIDTLTAPSAHARFVAASIYARRAAVLQTVYNSTVLTVLGKDEPPRIVVEINQHLRNVAEATPVRIDHKGPLGDERHSWLLLPPGYERGYRLPTVVNVYPGRSSPEVYNNWTVGQLHSLNDNLLAAHGYAVLYPSMLVDYEKLPRDPVSGFRDEVFAAVDAAIARGYVDPNRLAVQGQSYGGFTAGALVGLTDRFKSAVAQSGIYDLVSSYGEFDQRHRLDDEVEGPTFFGVSELETYQFGLGASPWNDPDRYLRNSPLMHVEAIHTPIMLIGGDLDYVSTTQSEEFFTALARLGKDAAFVRYYGEDHLLNSPANIRDMWARIFAWYERTLGPPHPVPAEVP